MTELNDFKEMVLVSKFFINYFNEVGEHLTYEDKVVFSYVSDLINQTETSKNPGIKSVSGLTNYAVVQKMVSIKSLSE